MIFLPSFCLSVEVCQSCHLNVLLISLICTTDNKENVPLEKVLFFFTGLEKVPVYGFETAPSLLFDSNSPYPKAVVCLNELTLPTQYTDYLAFKQVMTIAVTMHGGYGCY